MLLCFKGKGMNISKFVYDYAFSFVRKYLFVYRINAIILLLTFTHVKEKQNIFLDLFIIVRYLTYLIITTKISSINN